MVEQGTSTPEVEFWKAERRHRRVKEISQKDAAQIFGRDQSTISRFEANGGPLPRKEDVVSFANQLQLDPMEKELLLMSGGIAWSIDFHRDLLQILRGDKNKSNRVFSDGQIELILTKTLEALRKFSSPQSPQ